MSPRPRQPSIIDNHDATGKDLLRSLVVQVYEMREELHSHLAVHAVLNRILIFGAPCLLTVAGLIEMWILKR